MENKTRTSPQVCLFAQAGGTGPLPVHTRHLLREIARCGYRVHVALSGRDTMAGASHGLEEFDITFHARPNAGLDFGAWQFLLSAGCAQDASEILLANDSVFGPFAPLAPIVASMRAGGYDAWGMVRSEAITPHLQSWFVSFTPQALAAPPVARVFAQRFVDMTKDEIVLHGELGLGLAMQAAGLRTGASWSGRRGLARLLAVNPMHTDWLSVLRSGRAPFIKTELLRDNPAAIESATRWRQHLTGQNFFDPAWIVHYLETNPPRRQHRPARLRARLVQALASEDRVRALLGIALRTPGRALSRDRRI